MRNTKRVSGMKRVKGEESEESDLDKQDEKFEQRSKNAIFFFLRGLGDRRLFVVPTLLPSVTGTSMANKKMLRLRGGGGGADVRSKRPQCSGLGHDFICLPYRFFQCKVSLVGSNNNSIRIFSSSRDAALQRFAFARLPVL